MSDLQELTAMDRQIAELESEIVELESLPPGQIAALHGVVQQLESELAQLELTAEGIREQRDGASRERQRLEDALARCHDEIEERRRDRKRAVERCAVPLPIVLPPGTLLLVRGAGDLVCLSIHEAVRQQDTFAIEQFVSDGIDVDALERGSGERPLHLAVQQGEATIVGRLARAGADPRAPNESGISALELAEQLGRRGLVELLDPTASELDR